MSTNEKCVGCIRRRTRTPLVTPPATLRKETGCLLRNDQLDRRYVVVKYLRKRAFNSRRRDAVDSFSEEDNVKSHTNEEQS